jgi:hypothetical protein
MPEIELCPECGVPIYITEELAWLNSGVIVQSRDEKHRVVFIESENLDSLFKGVGEIIDEPIENIIIEGRRRGARDYVERFIPAEVKKLIENRQIDIEPIIASQMDATRVMGFGNPTLEGFYFGRERDEFITVRVEEPFSVPLWCASIAGACAAIVGGDWDVSYEILSPDEIEVKCFRPASPRETGGKYARKEYRHKDGGVELERCASCGGPAVLSGWYLDRGVIGSAYTDRRMAINGETGLQDVFAELERELGGGVAHAVIEAQRRFIKSGFFTIENIFSEGDFRTQFAYRGLGDLVEFMMGSTGLQLRLENSTLHLMVVGMAQALFELAFGKDSKVEWKLSRESVLQVKVTPRSRPAVLEPSSRRI